MMSTIGPNADTTRPQPDTATGVATRRWLAKRSTAGPWPWKRVPVTRSCVRGFTLLELIVVLVLISTVLALAAPSLRRFAHGRETTDAANHLLALTHLARSQAATQACIWRLNVDTQEAVYWLTFQEAGAFIQPQTAYGRGFRFPDGVTVTLDGPETDDETPFIQFYPDGRCDEATIELQETDGRILYVTCLSVAERFRIVTPQNEVTP